MRLARRLLALGVIVAILVLGWRFAAANSAAVTVDYLAGRFGDVSLWAALLGAFGVGAGFAALAGLYQIAKLRLMARRYRRTLRGLEAEVHQLRNLPLAAEGPDLSGSPDPSEVAPPRSLERGA